VDVGVRGWRHVHDHQGSLAWLRGRLAVLAATGDGGIVPGSILELRKSFRVE
jgi:hypothetical protein